MEYDFRIEQWIRNGEREGIIVFGKSGKKKMISSSLVGEVTEIANCIGYKHSSELHTTYFKFHSEKTKAISLLKWT